MSNNDNIQFYKQRLSNIESAKKDTILKTIKSDFVNNSADFKYTYNFDWLGLPIIQFPQDIIALQEIIWQTKPDIIIETGVARGGSIIFYASMLKLLNNNGKVIGVDIDIREHNRKAIENHPLSDNVSLIQGSSIDEKIVNQVKSHIKDQDKVMVILDSNHTHEHVLEELKFYSPFVTKDCYIAVMDTVIEDMPEDYFPDRPWGKGNNPKTAVHEFLKTNDRFEIDEYIHNKLLITVAPDGYLKCIK